MKNLWYNTDRNQEQYKKQIEVVNQVLQNIGAEKIPQLMVYNKIDKQPSFIVPTGAVGISAMQKIGIDKLKNEIYNLIWTLLKKD